MNTFVESVNEVQMETTTLNGMKTFDSSKDSLVDLFFSIGASRGGDLSVEFTKALLEDETLALRLLLWSRDVRGGAGERDIFRNILRYLEKNYPRALHRIFNRIPDVGRWDDLLIFETVDFKDKAYRMIRDSLESGNGLTAKWMPRQGPIAIELRNFLRMSPKQYRKMLVGLTNVVEQKMCANQWTDIDYGKLPSLASARYQKAFGRHDTEGYSQYKNKLESGEATVNAEAIYPHDVIKSVRNGDKDVALHQWNNLPNYMGDQLVLPMVDVSGSMMSPVNGNKNLTCMDVSVALGLYISDKNTGPFKDMFLTFSMYTELNQLKGNLIDKMNQLESSEWGMNTNLEKAFDTILSYAIKGNVKASDMPQYLLILSDMEFDAAVDENAHSQSAIEMIKHKYTNNGYTMPKIVFWNLNARKGNVPVKHNSNDVALVSGFSPSIMKAILSADHKSFTPENIMMETILNPRYDF